jgi:hypothetical protein
MEILDRSNTKKRLSYMFSLDDRKGDEKDDFCKDYKDNLLDSLINLVKKPHLTDRILNNFTILGSGMFGTVKKANLNLELVVKDNKNFIDDVNEIFINQFRINHDVIKKNNPNFPIIYSYILCKPSLDKVNKDRICTNDIINPETLGDINRINQLLSKKEIKLYGIYEYIEGKTLGSFISSLSFIKLTEQEKWLVIKNILIQVFSGLDKLSQSGGYTHFDLHPGNIMINMNKSLNYTYTLTGGETVKVNDNFRAFIIDQGVSSVEYDGKIFVYDMTYIPFIPAYDIYKLISSLYRPLANFDKYSKDYFHVKKLESLIITIFEDESIIKYINDKPNGDIITFMNKSQNEYVRQVVDNMTYSDMVLLLLTFE